MSTERVFRKALAPLARRIRHIIGRGVVRLIDDAGGLQVLQVTVQAGEVHQGAERFQDYGFTSHPHKGAEAVVGFVRGDRGHPVVLAVDDRRHRKADLAEGEVAMYTDEGDYILMRRGRIIEVVAGAELRVQAPTVNVQCDDATIAATNQATVDAPETTITGNVTIQGNLSVAGTVGAQGAMSSQTSVSDPDGSMADMRTVYNGHTHVDGDGSTTSQPSTSMG